MSIGIMQFKKLEVTQVSRLCADEKEFKSSAPDSLDDIVQSTKTTEKSQMSLLVSMAQGRARGNTCVLAGETVGIVTSALMLKFAARGSE
jgi:hypothetical protein